MPSSQTGTFRWRPASFVARQVPPHLIHDLRQPLNAYGLAAEQLSVFLNNDLSARSPAFNELAVMNRVIGELEASLWLLQEFWRLDSLAHAPALLPTSLDSVLKIALSRLEKRCPGLSLSVFGQKNNQCVQSSALWLGSLLSCVFESGIQKTRSGLNVEIISREDEVEITVKEKTNEGIQTLVFCIGEESNSGIEPANPELAEHVAARIAAILKCRLVVSESDVALFLPACNDADCLSVGKPELFDVLTGKRIAVFETEQEFSNDLAVLLRSWGCEVFHLSGGDEIQQYAKDGKFADALFLGFDVWQTLSREQGDADPRFEISKNVFVTVDKDAAALVPVGTEGCVFLPRPFSTIRLRKFLMALFSVPEIS